MKIFIHIEYSLQVYRYYNGVQDTMLQIDKRAIYIIRWPKLQ